MLEYRLGSWALAASLALCPLGSALGGDPGVSRLTRRASRDVQSMASRIDELVEGRLAAAGIPPASLADDAEFFRRLSLDLNGRIPAVVQLRDFLDDDRPDKRVRWIDELMDGRNNAALYTRHFTNVWRRTLLWSTPAQPAVAGSLEGWLTRQVEANAPYDRLVRAVLTDPGADAFFVANQRMPDSLAARTTRLFLGVKLECVQCHDDRVGGSWKRQQFWEFAAFFAGPQASSGAGGKPDENSERAIGTNPAPARIRIGNTEGWAEGRFLDGSRPDWGRGEPRTLLAEWIVGPENPWFARAAVNRVWHHFFGSGLVEPVDGLGDADRPPSHPELLDEMSHQFAAHGYNLKYLVRAIVASRTPARRTVASLPAPRFAASPRSNSLIASARLPGANWRRSPVPTRRPVDRMGHKPDSCRSLKTCTTARPWFRRRSFRR
jgi:hypothetical protein